MAKTRSAKKAKRVAERKRVFNVRTKKTMRTAVKNVVVNAKADTLSTAFQAIDKAAKRGIIKKNTAARMKSRVSRAVGAKK